MINFLNFIISFLKSTLKFGRKKAPLPEPKKTPAELFAELRNILDQFEEDNFLSDVEMAAIPTEAIVFANANEAYDALYRATMIVEEVAGFVSSNVELKPHLTQNLPSHLHNAAGFCDQFSNHLRQSIDNMRQERIRNKARRNI